MTTTASSLTIAQSLRRAKGLEGKVADLARRLAGCTSWIVGTPPAFNFEESLKAYDAAVAELSRLRVGIARANATAMLQWDGRAMTLTEGIRRQAELKGRIVMFGGFNLDASTQREISGYDDRGRPVMQDVRHVAVWTEAQRASELDKLREQLESLNEVLETANHGTRIEPA